MKNFKQLSILLKSVILAGIITFSACKKDDDPTGTEVAQDFCDCMTKAAGNEEKETACDDKFEKYASKLEKNEKFATDFMAEILQCKALMGSSGSTLGDEAAAEYCECLTNAASNATKIKDCEETMDSKYGSDMEDEDFAMDFMVELLKCAAAPK